MRRKYVHTLGAILVTNLETACTSYVISTLRGFSAQSQHFVASLHNLEIAGFSAQSRDCVASVHNLEIAWLQCTISRLALVFRLLKLRNAISRWRRF